MWKRTFDIAASFAGLVISSPLYLLLGLVIKLDSRGPILYKQLRVGRDKRLFTIYKFRTMVPTAESNGLQVTRTGDARITRVGRWLRALKLDELPQLWNVLKGDMSLVGPRPEVPKYVEHYSDREQMVLSVRPGLTDLASIYYRDESSLLPASDTEEFYVNHILHEKLKLNLFYINNRSGWLDVKIVLCTALVSFFPALTGKWMRASLHTGFFSHLFRSFLYRLRKVDRAMQGRWRLLVKIGLDAGLVAACYYLAYLIRFEGQIGPADWVGFKMTTPLLLVITIGVFYYSKLYRGLWEYAGMKDLFGLISVHTLAWALFTTSVIFLRTYWVPRSVLIIYWLLALLTLGGVRVLYRNYRRQATQEAASRRRVLIVGAGAAGEMVLRQMCDYPQYGYHPVGLVDDNSHLRDVRIHGVPVLGNQEALPRLVREKDAHEVIIAIPSATAEQMRRIVTKCEQVNVKVKKVPGPRELMDGQYHLSRLREVRIEDLLDREPVAVNQRQIASLLTGEFVLVTGAGGSIGQELCKQIAQFHPAHLVLLDRSENSLFYLENDLKQAVPGLSFSTVVGDVTDVNKCAQVFQHFNPKIIFHAAAHKHVPLMESNPEEAIKNNLFGTMTVADLAERYGAKSFVLISTDKAVAPTSIMGISKRLAELLIQACYRRNGKQTRFSTVRFGNVLGSNGSVLTLFEKQIARGGPVTITDPEMTRYFMTISEAVSLILYASTMATGGETFVLDMGEPIKVVDLARHYIVLSGYDPELQIPLQVVGRRPGEKLHETLWNEDETPEPTACKKIYMAKANGIDADVMLEKLRGIVRFAERMDRDSMYAAIDEILNGSRDGRVRSVPQQSIYETLA